MSEYKDRIHKLKAALLEYLMPNGRHYGDKTRSEQGVEDLAQALNTRLDQLLLTIDEAAQEKPQSPREQLANRLLMTSAQLMRRGKVDAEMADDFERALEAFDLAADLKRQAETATIKHKRDL